MSFRHRYLNGLHILHVLGPELHTRLLTRPGWIYGPRKSNLETACEHEALPTWIRPWWEPKAQGLGLYFLGPMDSAALKSAWAFLQLD
jgi:hypothetical protein